MKMLKLNNGEQIPALGLGTWLSPEDKIKAIIPAALEIGYRHFDFAWIYQNENIIGPALSQAMKDHNVSREQLFLTSKLWNNRHEPSEVMPALKESLHALEQDYLDLYLIHWPVHFKKDHVFPQEAAGFIKWDELDIAATWQALEECVKAGLVKSIGTANFGIENLSYLMERSTIKPAVNQFEHHPYHPRQELVDFCQKNNIVMTAYSPLGTPGRPDEMKQATEPNLLGDSVVAELAAKHQATPAQILIAYALSKGLTVIPKTVTPKRAQENFDSLKIELSENEIEALTSTSTKFSYVDGRFFTQGDSPYTTEMIWR